ncbi:MAG: Spy/CpxP family protein refolding chaperone [Steroidobacteraceae bacterium]|jgi:hypothetical protein
MSVVTPVFAADDGNSSIAASSVSHPPPDPAQWHMQALHDRLRITPAQEPLWAAVADLVRRNDETIDAISRERRESAATMSAIDDLRSFAAISAAHAAGTKAFLPAFAALYGIMPAEQRANADRVFRDADPILRAALPARR